MPVTVYTKPQVLKQLRDYCDKYKTYAAAAEKIGCTRPVLSSVLSGTIPPPPSVCKALGIERVKLYASGVEDRHRE